MPASAGLPEVTRLICDRRAQYYDLVASELRQGHIAAARDMNAQALLWRAFTDLLMPRLTRSDDRLHRLLYGRPGGRRPVPVGRQANPILTATYVQAAQAQRAGGLNGPLVLDTIKGDCAQFRAREADAVATCVSKAAAGGCAICTVGTSPPSITTNPVPVSWTPHRWSTRCWTTCGWSASTYVRTAAR
ncbi:hypothetical protein [Actinomadura sp. DC4]|uniref:hypothetical protein n=1 Tax=Actinomadura sp. DC4 TaxID=3055069 RepID=UPI0025AED6DE|nr:hypothetical protein [Actinomadura sp. DC4]MDN3354491.1 hypothetical protein [Actinomadura sp. DC4]